MKLLLKYFPDLTPAQMKLFEQLATQIIHWNNKINVISRKDTAHLEERHILHSLAIANYIKFQPKSQIIDVGTGGGFPGLPLAIMFPDVQFTLVDSIQKKIKVVTEIANALNINNVNPVQQRAEKINGKYDFVISRAVTAFPRFLDWTQKLISNQSKHDLPNGILALKGGDLSNELAGCKNSLKTIPVNNYFKEEWFNSKYIVYWHS